ncbi:MAG: serine/threonine protein kinase [Planctomycetaceae bacterium]|nr:serine/threonine protein kinase [Planctomycetaceae bacterium]
MSEPTAPPDPLDQAVAEYLAAVESGAAPDRAALLERFGDISDKLTQFFADHDRLTGLAQPIRALIASADDTPRQTGGSDATMTFDPDARPVDLRAGTATSAGQRIGDYEVIRELGRGGMGVVYQARHVTLNRVVALKMILSGQFATDEDRERFQAEARAAAPLDHPGIVSIYEVGQYLGQPFFAMPLVEGPSLADVLQPGPLPPQIAARLMRKIVDAVAYAHAHGVIHRDLKPANVLLSPMSNVQGPKLEWKPGTLDLGHWTPCITDFGLAKRLDGESQLTASGQLLGTPTFMSPEQAAGRVREVGPAADIYSLGAILYVMLTGQPPFWSDNPVEVILHVLESDPPLPRTLRPETPRELEWICLKCLEKKPADRYASAQHLADDLDRYLRHEPVEARLPTWGQQLRRWMRRQPVLAWHALCLGLFLALMQGIFLAHPQRELVYHLKISGIVCVWLAVSYFCQWMQNRERDAPWSHYFWLGADAALLTALLSQLDPSPGPLVASYFVLIAISGLFFETRLVAFTTAAVALAAFVLFLLRPAEAEPLHYALLFMASLVMTGCVVGYQVWRMGVLREFYDERRPR